MICVNTNKDDLDTDHRSLNIYSPTTTATLTLTRMSAPFKLQILVPESKNIILNRYSLIWTVPLVLVPVPGTIRVRSSYSLSHDGSSKNKWNRRFELNHVQSCCVKKSENLAVNAKKYSKFVWVEIQSEENGNMCRQFKYPRRRKLDINVSSTSS